MTKRHRITPVLFGLTLLILSGCEWVKSDLDGCPSGYWLELDYSYNLQDIDAASKLEDITVLAYDSLGNYVSTINSTKAERSLNDGLIELKDFKPGRYTFVVWAGLADDRHFASYHSLGILTMDSLKVGLKYPSQVQRENFGDLYYGSASGVRLSGAPGTYRVRMMKDTNKLVCLVRYTNSEPVTTERFTMEVTATDGTMDARNEPIGTETVTYLPYSEEDVTITDEAEGTTVTAARYGFQLMRLLAKDDSRLRLKRKATGGVAIDLPLTQYIAQVSVLYNLYGHPLTVQEYLDRQDFHTFVFYLSKENDDMLAMLRINNWIVRLDDDINLRDEK